MLSEDGLWFWCNMPDCDNKVKNNRWAKIKAEGWFFSRDDKMAWCPAHLPYWRKK